MIEYLEIKKLLKRAEVVSHNHGRMVLKLDIITVKKVSINPNQVARHFREIDGIEEFHFDPEKNRLDIDYDTQKIEPGLLDSIIEISKEETEREDKKATLNDYKINEIPSSPKEIEAIRYKNPALAEKIELVHQLRFILTVYEIKESGISVVPLKGILKKLGVNGYGDIFSQQGIASIGQELLSKFLAKTFE